MLPSTSGLPLSGEVAETLGGDDAGETVTASDDPEMRSVGDMETSADDPKMRSVGDMETSSDDPKMRSAGDSSRSPEMVSPGDTATAADGDGVTG